MWKFIILMVATAVIAGNSNPDPTEYTKMSPEHCEDICSYYYAEGRFKYDEINQTCACIVDKLSEKEQKKMDEFYDKMKKHNRVKIGKRSTNEQNRENADNVVGASRFLRPALVPRILSPRPLVPIKPLEHDAIKAANIRKNLRDLSIKNAHARAANTRFDELKKTLNHFSKKISPKNHARNALKLIDGLKTSPIKKQIRMKSRIAPAIKILPHTKLLGSTQDKNTDTSNVKQKKSKSRKVANGQSKENFDESDNNFSNSGIITQPKNLFED